MTKSWMDPRPKYGTSLKKNQHSYLLWCTEWNISTNIILKHIQQHGKYKQTDPADRQIKTSFELRSECLETLRVF